MSAIPVVTPADLPAMRTAAARPARWIRDLAFAGLCAFGVARWSRLLAHPPLARLYGLAGLAVALAVLVPLVRRSGARRGSRAALLARVGAWLLALIIIIAALPVSGLRLEWVLHVRIAVGARAIGDGLGGLDAVLVPYLGHSPTIRLVMTLGAAVLLLDAAAALAFLARPDSEPGDGRRAAAALPLVALAIVPSTLVPPRLPALQGLLLFGLLALFVWGERVLAGRRGAALALGCVAGLAGVITVPTLSSRPWVDYRAWGAASIAAGPESFNWNQTYGPLSWPARGRTVFTVRARVGDYWKTEDLTAFDGQAWVAGPSVGAGANGGPLAPTATAPGTTPAAAVGAAPPGSGLPSPSPAAVRRYTHTIQVRISGMETTDVIGGSGIMLAPPIPGGVREGSVPGTWTAARTLGPGDTYPVTTYSPTPSATELLRASERAYPWRALTSDLSLTLPASRGTVESLPFPDFHQPLGLVRERTLAGSPYAPAVTLARRLAAHAATPYAFVQAVQHELDSGRYTYDQRPLRSRYPLIDFLFHSRIGYCQQFSGAMAMLLRMGGVPARVATGFTSGSLDRASHTWTVSDTDAHAWVEVWFPSYGWVRFDPTPGRDPALRGSALADEPRPGAISRALDVGHVPQLRTRHSTATTPAPRSLHGPRGSVATSAASRRGAGVPWGTVAGGAALVLLLTAALWAHRRRAPADPLEELERALARTGRPLTPGATLAGLEHRFHGSPDAEAYVRALRLERYGHASGAVSATGRRAVRAELAAGLGLAGRLRALWALPPRP